MIPSYLKSLAATVRDLVASGKAVHVTNETAAELDLLAGLPWREACWFENGIEDPLFRHECTPADLALGWLLASRAMPQTEWVDCKRDVIGVERITDGGAKRAAECAELTMLGAVYLVLQPQPRGDELGAMLMPHGSTREGARAAWGFVVRCIEMQQRNSMVAHAFEGKPQTWQAWQGMRDRYRRELEAM